MAQESRLSCRKCGEPLTSEQSEGWCLSCYPDPRSTIKQSQGFPSTVESLPGEWNDSDAAPQFQIDDYQLIRTLGKGGMGMVYLARQLSAGRLVALKVILSERLVGLPDHRRNHAIERFMNESRAAAQLNHENIVTVFDVGECGGRNYYTMRYVEGDSLSFLLKDGPLGNRPAARYIEAIARAIHEAHRAGVLHRDIKPANILVDRATDRPLVADFGLAKMLTNDSEMTLTGEVFGSPPYMSPEQARSAGDVTESADIYSLGATLYHLLTGRPPFQAASSVETLKQVMNDEPVSPREVNPAVDVDLETIVLKCLSKEPDQRYPSALAISQDLAAFLEGRTISARPASTWDRLIRWKRRNPAIALWMSVAAILLVVGTIVSSTLAMMESRQRTAAEFNEALANDKKTLAEKKEAEAVELAARLRNSLAVVEQQRKQARRDAFTSSISASFAYLQNAEPERIGDRLDRLQLSDAEIDDAGFEFHYLHRQANLRPRMIPAHTASAEAVAFSPDGKIIASGGQDFVAELWSAENGEHLRSLYASHDPVTALAFSPDSKHLVAGTQDTGLPGHETRVDVWDYNTGTLVTTLPHHCSVHRLVFSLNGQYLITATADPDELGELRIYRTSDWSLMKKLEGHTPGNAGHIWGIADVAILWDNKQLASAGFEGRVKLWDIEKGVEVRTLSGHSGWVRSVAFDSTGKSVVSGSDDHTIRFWDTQNGQQTRIFRDGVGITTTIAFDRRYRSLITASQLGLLKWDLQSGQAVSLGSPRALNGVAFSPDGRMLAAARPDGMLEIWDYEAAGKSLPLEHSGWSASAAFSDDGTILASGSGRKSINVFDIPKRTLLYEIADQPHVVTDVWFSPKSRYLVTKCPNGSKNREDLRLWDARTGEPITPLIDEGDIGIDHIAFSSDGHLAAVERHNLQHVQQNAQVGGGGTVEIWDLDTKRMVSQVKAGNADDAVFQSFCFAPDGKSLLTNSSDTLDTCDVATGQLLSSVPLGRILQDIQIEADQLLVLTTVPKKSDEYALKKINTSTNAIEDLGTVPYCEFLAVSRDGRWLAFRDRSLPGSQLTIWDCQRHCLHDILKSHQQAINGAVFASNSRTLITVSLDMTVRFRDVESRQEIGIIRGHTQPIFAVDISPKEDWLVTGAGDPLHGVGSGKRGELFLWNATATSNSVAGVPGGPELREQKRWEIRNVEPTVNSWEYSGDGRVFAIAHHRPHRVSDDSTPAIVDIWNTQDGTCVDSISPFTGVAHICLTHDGRKIAAARRLERTRTFVEKDGERIELPPAPEPQTVVVHELGSQAEDWLFDVDFEEAHALCFSQDGTGLLVAGSAGEYEYWNIREQKCVLQNVLQLDRIHSVAVAPNGKWAALGGEISNEPSDATAGSACVVVIDLGNGSEVVRLDGGSFPVTDLQFSTQGTLLAASSGYRAQSSDGPVFRKITVWDTSEWKVFSDLQIDSSSMARLRFSSDDRFLTAGTNSFSHAVLDVKSGRWRLCSSSDRTVRRFGARMSHEGTMELLDWKGNTLSAKSSPESQLRMQNR